MEPIGEEGALSKDGQMLRQNKRRRTRDGFQALDRWKAKVHPENWKFFNYFVEARRKATTARQFETYSRVLRALQSYPLPLSTQQEAEQLDGVGDYLSSFFGRILLNQTAATPGQACLPGANDKADKTPAALPLHSPAPSICTSGDRIEGGAGHVLVSGLSCETGNDSEEGPPLSSLKISTAVQVYIEGQRSAAERLAAVLLNRQTGLKFRQLPGAEGTEKSHNRGSVGDACAVLDISNGRGNVLGRKNRVRVPERAGAVESVNVARDGESSRLENGRETSEKESTWAGVSDSRCPADISDSQARNDEEINFSKGKGGESRKSGFRKCASAWTALVCLYRLKAFDQKGVSRTQIQKEQEELSKIYPCRVVSGSVLETLRLEKLVGVSQPSAAAVRAASVALDEQLDSAANASPFLISSAHQLSSSTAKEAVKEELFDGRLRPAHALNDRPAEEETTARRRCVILRRGEDRDGDGTEVRAVGAVASLDQEAPRCQTENDREAAKRRLLKKCCHDHLERLFLTEEGKAVAERLVDESPGIRTSSAHAPASCLGVEALHRVEKDQFLHCPSDAHANPRRLDAAEGRGTRGEVGKADVRKSFEEPVKRRCFGAEEACGISVESSSFESDGSSKSHDERDARADPCHISSLSVNRRSKAAQEIKEGASVPSETKFGDHQPGKGAGWQLSDEDLSSESSSTDTATASLTSKGERQRLCGSFKKDEPHVVSDKEDGEAPKKFGGEFERLGESWSHRFGIPSTFNCSTPVRRRPEDGREPLSTTDSPSPANVPGEFRAGTEEAKGACRRDNGPREWRHVGHAFQVCLVLDNRERVEHGVGGWGGGINRAEFLSAQLRRNGVLVELRPLPVGDAIWVARQCSGAAEAAVTSPIDTRDRSASLERSVANAPKLVCRVGAAVSAETTSPMKKGAFALPAEFVLPLIVERKTLRDLSSSIRDGRYEDQKYRLMRCAGVTRVLYLVEGLLEASQCPAIPLSTVTFAGQRRNPGGSGPSVQRFPGSQRPGVPGGSTSLANASGGRAFLGGPLSTSAATMAAEIAAVRTAQVKTQLVNGFSLLNTTCPAHTVAMLTRIHRRLVRQFSADAVVPQNTHKFCSETSARGAEAAEVWRRSDADVHQTVLDIETSRLEASGTEVSGASSRKVMERVIHLFLLRKKQDETGLSGDTLGVCPMDAAGNAQVVELLSWSEWLEKNRQSAKCTVQEVFCRQLSVLPFLGKRGAAHIAKACGHPAAFARLLKTHPDDRHLRTALALAALAADQAKSGQGKPDAEKRDENGDTLLLTRQNRQTRRVGEEMVEDKNSESEPREPGERSTDRKKRKRRDGLQLDCREQGRISAINTGSARPQAISSKALALCRLLYQDEVPASVLDAMQPLAVAASTVLENKCAMAAALTPCREQVEREGNIL
ncbi:putative MUS81 endonuclease, related protein [Toxoplasma gondii TgCatPRC2]|uniref:Crossover junction endonuclease MUS81 n=2 Tax=Toxoplasma gondii TaxID=5811 RepID=A0A151HMJ2_TOXGO|nr:putative MUS81 endonuclease, related protein [Toxoplasma gondii TgCatPRC2]